MSFERLRSTSAQSLVSGSSPSLEIVSDCLVSGSSSCLLVRMRSSGLGAPLEICSMTSFATSTWNLKENFFEL